MSERRLEPQQILRRAVDLQAEADEAARDAKDRATMAQAAAELGIDPERLDVAAATLRAEAAASERAEAVRDEERRVQRQRRVILAAVAGAMIVAGLGLRASMAPSAAVSVVAAPAAWSLDLNPETQATLTWPTDPVYGEVARIDVAAFGAAAGSPHRVNFDGLGTANLSGHHTVSVTARGQGLDVLRVYLEDGDERWRSPPLRPGADWSTLDAPLSAFERQERGASGWKIVSWAAPGDVHVSVKLGDYMNPVTATGHVEIDGWSSE